MEGGRSSGVVKGIPSEGRESRKEEGMERAQKRKVGKDIEWMEDREDIKMRERGDAYE